MYSKKLETILLFLKQENKTLPIINQIQNFYSRYGYLSQRQIKLVDDIYFKRINIYKLTANNPF